MLNLKKYKWASMTLVIISALAIILTGCGKDPFSNAKTIATPPNYNLIPVLTLDNRNVFLNAEVTPLEFFSVQCSHCKDDLPKMQKTLQDIKAQKPIIYVGTFYDTTDPQKAIQETKDFISKNKLSGTFVVQTGDPHAYVQNVPALVHMDQGQTKPAITEGLPSKDVLTKLLSDKESAPVTNKSGTKQTAPKK